MPVFTLALCQTDNTPDKQRNLQQAYAAIQDAAQKGADIAALGEYFSVPYDTALFEAFAEPLDGPTAHMLKSATRDARIYVLGGSMIERREGRLYNTALFYSPEGELLACYRKAHLFDARLPGGGQARESAVLSRGGEICVVDTPWCKMGIAICYDLRFAEWFSLLARRGADVILVPAAFTKRTGPLHFQLLLRARAVDNQVFVAGISPARQADGNPVYAHSTCVDPWGNVLCEAGEKRETLLCRIDTDICGQMRDALPVRAHRREDLYQIVDKTLNS